MLPSFFTRQSSTPFPLKRYQQLKEISAASGEPIRAKKKTDDNKANFFIVGSFHEPKLSKPILD
jgi:hypothetical protein